MNLIKPISTIMSKQLVTAHSEEKILDVVKRFQENHVHHIPVVEYHKVVGILSKSDVLFLLKMERSNSHYKLESNILLAELRVKDLMTSGLAKLESTDRIIDAIEVFRVNMFHALPIVDQDELVGILTTHDIIKLIAKEPIALSDYEK